jgi:ATP/maltotriose-dependent transcriptional regulator MalT
MNTFTDMTLGKRCNPRIVPRVDLWGEKMELKYKLYTDLIKTCCNGDFQYRDFNLSVQDLIRDINDNQDKIIYIHAGAGYGKTILLAQLAHSFNNVAWLSLSGEKNISYFVNSICESIAQAFPNFNFTPLEFFPFSDREDFIKILADALIASIERLENNLLLILDDLHTITNKKIRDFIIYFVKFAPTNIRLCLSSREALWKELLSLSIRDHIYELDQHKLEFTKEETELFLGANYASVYKITEGWPLAVGSFKILIKKVYKILIF